MGLDPNNVKWTIHQGADFILTLTFLSCSGTPVDMTGYYLSSQVRATESLTSTLLATMNFTWQNGDPTTGIGILSIPWTTALTFTWTKGYYDIFQNSNDIASRDWLMQGQIINDAAVTASG